MVDVQSQMKINEQEQLDQALKHLMIKACAAPKNSRQRNQCLTKVVELVQQSNRLHYYASPLYPDALQETWFRVFRRPETYDPNKAEVIGWINVTLKYRLKDAIKNNSDPPRILHQGEYYYNLLENLPAPPHIPPMLEETLHWIKTDPQRLLTKTHLRNRPDINAQLLLSERFPPATKWDVLVKEFEVPRTTLYKFYQEKCLPLLRGFGYEQGYF